MNVALILSGGVGKRIGASIPKQYLEIRGKKIISYVIDACRGAGNIDKIVVAAHQAWIERMENLREFGGIDFCIAGNERNETLKKGIDYIAAKYACDKIILLDSVRPLVSAELLEEYISLLDDNDIVLTAQKITDSLGCYDIHEVDRSRYYLLQSPEGYNFKLLHKYFKQDSRLTEVAQQLPQGTKTYLNFNFENNLKITYKHDLVVAEHLLGLNELNAKFDVKRLKEYLGKNYPIEAEQWISDLSDTIKCLQFKWKFNDYEVFGNSHFGLILKATSSKYSEVIVKLIPPFIGRFEGEESLYKLYENAGIMCPLYDSDPSLCALLLKRACPGNHAEFDAENENDVLEFFGRLNDCLIKYDGQIVGHDYAEILKDKLQYTAPVSFRREVEEYVRAANFVYDKTFASKDRYILLGDAHKYNLLKDGKHFVAIDPIGYIAPKEFEAARYIGTVLTEHIDDADAQLKHALDKFSEIYDRELIEKALFVDIVFRLHNTTFEDEDDTLRKKWLKALKCLRENI